MYLVKLSGAGAGAGAGVVAGAENSDLRLRGAGAEKKNIFGSTTLPVSMEESCRCWCCHCITSISGVSCAF